MSRKRATVGDGCLGHILFWGLFGGSGVCAISIADKNVVGAIIGAAAFFGTLAILMYNEVRGEHIHNHNPQDDTEKALDRKIHYIPCPKCGRAVDASLNKCGHCGYKLIISPPEAQDAQVARETQKKNLSPNATPEEKAKEVYYIVLSLASPISRDMSDRVFDQNRIISDTYRKDGKDAAIRKVRAVCKSWVSLGNDGVLGVEALINSLKGKVLTSLEADNLMAEVSDWSIGNEKTDDLRKAYERAVAVHGKEIFISRPQGSLIQSSIATIMGISNPTVDDLDWFYDMYAFFGHYRANNIPVKDTVVAFIEQYHDYFNDDYECMYHVIAFCVLKLSDKDGDKIYYSHNTDPTSVYIKNQVDNFARNLYKKRPDDSVETAEKETSADKREDAHWKCPNCGNVVGIHDVFCSQCGVRLNYSTHISALNPEDAKNLSYDDKLIIQNHKNIAYHTIPVNAVITIIRASGNEKKETVSVYQKAPNTFYIDRTAYDRLKAMGVLCVQVYDGDKESERRYAENGFGSLDDQSLLAKCGYTTKASENLTDVQRQKVLLYLLKNDYWTKKRLVSHLEWCVRNHPQDMYELNRIKWEKDIQYVKQVIV